ncbi:hypothetical protein GGF37_003570 [Kickxella alabastrina]|nr:hypothetical protein GGF37_003570 [Kickxella alabastrina]
MDAQAKVKLVGVRMSTFTRTIRMALEYLQVPYEQMNAPPHSPTALEYNPFDKVPTLVHNELVINETPAIRMYIDHTFAQNTSNSQHPLTPIDDFKSAMNVAMWVSIASDYAFKDLILSLCKKRAALEGENTDEEKIKLELEKPAETARLTLRRLQSVFSRTNGGWEGKGFIVGDSISWADLFLYPIFADLCSVPEQNLVEEEAPGLFAWYQSIEKLNIAINTFDGTVASLRPRVGK